MFFSKTSHFREVERKYTFFTLPEDFSYFPSWKCERKCKELRSKFNYFYVELSNSEKKLKNSKNFPKLVQLSVEFQFLVDNFPLPESGKFLKKTYPVIQNINIYKKIIKITKKNE
jgi:hypothetical protein